MFLIMLLNDFLDKNIYILYLTRIKERIIFRIVRTSANANIWMRILLQIKRYGN